MASKKNAIPKKIAGMKVPKKLRKSRLLRAMLASEIGRDILANALTAAAGAATTVLVRDREDVAEAGKKTARKSARAIDIGTEAVRSAARAAMDVVTSAADDVIPKQRRNRFKSKEGGSGSRSASH